MNHYAADGHPSLSAVATSISEHEISPLDVTAACLETAEKVEPHIHAFAELDTEGAIAQARTLTEELAHSPPRSSLHGIPIAIKDLIDVKGLPSRAGSAVLERTPAASADAPLVARLRAAGAVIVGKTHTHEFALGVITPSTRNPHNTTCAAGGSSGGSAAAVASRECFGAIGTDTGGSVRIPAALCGVVGLKNRRNSIPLDGTVPLSPLLDSAGVLACSVADTRLILDAFDVTTTDVDERTLRVGVIEDSALGDIESDVASAFDTSMRLSAQRGDLIIRPAVVPPFIDWFPDRVVPLIVDALLVHESKGWYPTLRDRYGTDLRNALGAASKVSATEIIASLGRLRTRAEALMTALDDHDALVLPTTPIVAPTLDEAIKSDDGGTRPEIARALLSLTGPMNWCPVAAVSLPGGKSSLGLPTGVQVVARTESMALRVAERIEEALTALPT